jgi:predicted RNase H-like HicB family nuclease
MTRRYAVIYERGPSSVGAYVPDLPGCVAVGKTLAEVEQLIHEAVVFHLEGMKLHGEETPEPASLIGYVEVDMTRVQANVAAERKQPR